MPKRMVDCPAGTTVQDSFWIMTGDVISMLLTPPHYMRVQNWDPDPTHVLLVRTSILGIGGAWQEISNADPANNYVDMMADGIGWRLQFMGKDGQAVNNIRLIYNPISTDPASRKAE